MMNDRAAVEQLRTLERPLRAAGLTALYLFGSTGRGEDDRASDIDLLFETDRPGFSLLDQAQIQHRLAAALNGRVDLLERSALRGAIRPRVEAEMIRIF